MGKKLTKKELKKKRKYHEKRVEFYNKKLKECEEKKKRIGFKFYN